MEPGCCNLDIPSEPGCNPYYWTNPFSPPLVRSYSKLQLGLDSNSGFRIQLFGLQIHGVTFKEHDRLKDIPDL